MRNYHKKRLLSVLCVSGGLPWAFIGTRPNWSENMCCKVCTRSTFFVSAPDVVLCLCFETLQFIFCWLNWLFLCFTLFIFHSQLHWNCTWKWNVTAWSYIRTIHDNFFISASMYETECYAAVDNTPSVFCKSMVWILERWPLYWWNTFIIFLGSSKRNWHHIIT